MRSIRTEAMREPQSAFAPGPAPMLQWVAVADLVVDEAYQRPIRGAGAKNIAAIAEAFCWSKFAPLIVSPVAGGRYAVIDGQHRATAAALRGVESLPAQVVIAGPAEQAAAFRAVNGQTTRMHALEIHRAAVAAGDAEALELERVCAAAGVIVSTHPRAQDRIRPGATNAVNALRAQLRRVGEDTMVVALRCVTGSANNQPAVLSALVIDALCAMVASRPAWLAQGERLAEAFNGIVILREADKARFQPRAQGVATWEVLRDRLSERAARAMTPPLARAS